MPYMPKSRASGEGTLRKHARGGWEWRTPHNFPVRKSIYAKTQKKCLEKRDEFLRRHGAGLVVTEDSTLTEYMRQWLEDTVRPQVRRNTYDHHRRMAENHIIPEIGYVKLTDLSPAHVQSLHRAKSEYAISTQRHIHTTLSAALRQAERWRQIERNVAALVGAPRAPATVDTEEGPDPKMRALTEEQAKKLLSLADGRYRALYSLALATGMRQGELFGLQWRHVDLSEGIVSVRQSLVVVSGGDPWWEMGPPKTEKSRRDIELRPEAIQALREHRKMQLEERMKLGGAMEDYGLVFSNKIGTPYRRENVRRKNFHPLLERAGLPKIRFHDLRHTFASIMLSRGAPIHVVSNMLGHTSVKVTWDIYSHILPGDQGRALGALDGVFG